jgi:hypothetical protein
MRAPSSPTTVAPPANLPPEKKSWPRIASTPFRGTGTPPRTGPRRRLSWGEEKANALRGDPRGKQVASSDSWSQRIESGAKVRSRNPNSTGEEGAIEEFFGQLWLFPSAGSSQPEKARVSQRDSQAHLVWIRRDLWESKSFTPEDCCALGSNDTWVKAPVKLSFAEAVWGKGERESFVQVVKKSMAGRGRGGGRMRPRNPEEEWGWGGGYPPYPHPAQYYPLPPIPPPPQYGYFHGHPPFQSAPPTGFGYHRPRGQN